MLVHRMLRTIEALLPPVCVLCGARATINWQSATQTVIDICVRCIEDLPPNVAACVQCAEQLPVTGRETELCGACLRRPLPLHQAYCAYRYSYPVDHLIRALKYRGRLAYARVLGKLLAQSLAAGRVAPWPEILIPVPLAAQRFRERGFNQAIEVGVEVAKHLRIPMRNDLLVRQRPTSEQAGLDRIGRRKNVRGAFAMQAKLPAKHVGIVDDVITTGSTVNEIAKVLRRAGAQRIEVWAVARASR